MGQSCYLAARCGDRDRSHRTSRTYRFNRGGINRSRPNGSNGSGGTDGSHRGCFNGTWTNGIHRPHRTNGSNWCHRRSLDSPWSNGCDRHDRNHGGDRPHRSHGGSGYSRCDWPDWSHRCWGSHRTNWLCFNRSWTYGCNWPNRTDRPYRCDWCFLNRSWTNRGDRSSRRGANLGWSVGFYHSVSVELCGLLRWINMGRVQCEHESSTLRWKYLLVLACRGGINWSHRSNGCCINGSWSNWTDWCNRSNRCSLDGPGSYRHRWCKRPRICAGPVVHRDKLCRER